MLKWRRMRLSGHVARIGRGGRIAYRALVGKPEGKIPLRKPRHRWEDNIKIYLGGISRESAVGIATGYGLHGRGVGVRVPIGPRIFSSPRCLYRLWGPPNLLFSGYRGLFPRGEAAGAWSWPLTSYYCRGQEHVDLYIHSPIRLHGVVLN
jgi:hypothetical protein